MFTATRPADHVPMLHVQIILINDQVTRLQIHYLTDILPEFITTNFCPISSCEIRIHIDDKNCFKNKKCDVSKVKKFPIMSD